MNLGEMRTEARNIFGETDASNSAISDATLNSWANEAYRFICTKLETIPITERTYTIASEITLNSSTQTIDIAKILTQPSDKWEELEIIDLDELAILDPDWENEAVDQPKYLVRKATFTALLYPPPDTDHNGVADGIKTYGLEFKTLSADTDTPDLPLNMHDVFPHFMAYRAFSRLQDAQRSAIEITMVNSLLKSQKHMSTKFSNRRGWRMLETDED